MGNELRNRLGRKCRVHGHDEGGTKDACNRSDVAEEIKVELIKERRVDRVRRRHQKKRIAVRLRAHRELGADVAIWTRVVLDEEGLAKPLRQPLTNKACNEVYPSPRRERRR